MVMLRISVARLMSMPGKNSAGLAADKAGVAADIAVVAAALA